MKKILLSTLTIAFSVLIAVGQTQNGKTKKPNVNEGNVQQYDTLRYKGSSRVDTTSLITVNQTAIPAPLRTTLKDSEYSGWEKGTLYQDPKSKGYILRLKPDKGGSAKKPNWFKFDSQGKRIPEISSKSNK